MAVLVKSGQTTRTMVSQNDYQGRDWPNGWKEDAAKHRAPKVYDCGHEQTFDAVVTCLILGLPTEIGTMCFGGGHAITIVGFFYRDGKWWLKILNSWGDWTNCNNPGYDEFPEEKISNGLDMFGAFGVEAVSINPDDKQPEVVG
jgi:hypothetical protein